MEEGHFLYLLILSSGIPGLVPLKDASSLIFQASFFRAA